jgi:hypothetical protein
MVRRSLAAHTADQTLPQARLAEDQHSIQAHCQLKSEASTPSISLRGVTLILIILQIATFKIAA